MHNFGQQRRNMTNHCVEGGKETDDPFAANFWTPRVNPATGVPYVNTDPGSRNPWGVDLNRNNTFGTLFDGYIGASHSCTSDTYAGPGEASEPEIKNELWIADTFKNIKFSNNIHSFGGYFMWAPGAYLPDRGEGDAVHANIGVEKYFFEAGDRILNRIKEHRNTAILPERTGPIADVLYSAGGNSADEHWYNRGVIAYSFETGADRYGNTVAEPARRGRARTGIRLADRTGFGEGDKIIIDAGHGQRGGRGSSRRWSTRTRRARRRTSSSTAALSQAHAAGAVVAGGTTQIARRLPARLRDRGQARGARVRGGQLRAARVGARLRARHDAAGGPDDRPARVARRRSTTTFEYVNEPSVIHYTTDGSTPTESSPVWDSTGPREPGEVFHVTETTTFRWRAEDIKGNVSFGSRSSPSAEVGGAPAVRSTAAPVTAASMARRPLSSRSRGSRCSRCRGRARRGGSGRRRRAPRVGGAGGGPPAECRRLGADAARDVLRARVHRDGARPRATRAPAVAAITGSPGGERGFLLADCHGIMHTVGRTYARDDGVTLGTLMDVPAAQQRPGLHGRLRARAGHGRRAGHRPDAARREAARVCAGADALPALQLHPRLRPRVHADLRRPARAGAAPLHARSGRGRRPTAPRAPTTTTGSRSIGADDASAAGRAR